MHPSSKWDHLAVKLHVQFKSPVMVPDGTNDEAEGFTVGPIIGNDNVEWKVKAGILATDVLWFQIEGGYLVYDPKIPNEKIGSIKVLPRQPGEENSIFPGFRRVC